MPATKVNVTIQCYSPDGDDLPLAEVSATLSIVDIGLTGYILPQTIEGVADATGLLVMPLWPNALGETESYYKVSITDPENGKVTKISAVIPNNDCNLHDVALLPPYPGKPDGQAAVDKAWEWANNPEDDPVETGPNQYSSLHSAAKAADSATAAAASETAAGTSETNAATSATAASGSATAAAASETAAQTAQTAAELAETNAETAETAAVAAKVAAELAETNAETAETNAAASASAASTSETNAGTSETNAASSASSASSSASAASTSETNAETAETNAVAARDQAISTVSSVAAAFEFDDSIVMGDPTTGKFRFNNAAVGSTTQIAFDALTDDAGNPDLSDYIATWGASTNTVKGFITFRKSGVPATFAIFSITAAVTDNTGWLQVAVTHVASNGAWSVADGTFVSFTRSGDSSAGDMLKSENLSGLANYTTARSNMGLGDSATKNVGVGAGDVAAGNHLHTGVYEPADATILKDADIGSSIQAYDADLDWIAANLSTAGKALIDDADAAAQRATLGVGTAAYKDGLTFSINSTDSDHDIDIDTGRARDSADDYDLVLSSVLIKQIDAIFAAGTNAGGMFTGSVASSTRYYVHLIRKDSDGTIDAGYDTSATAANIPSGYTAYRKLGSVLTDGSSNLDSIQVEKGLGNPEYSISGQQTITSAGALTIAHGLSKAPAATNISFMLTCTSAEGGYSVGNTININSGAHYTSVSGDKGFSMLPDSTNLNLRFAADTEVIMYIRKDTGARISLANSSWKLTARAFI